MLKLSDQNVCLHSKEPFEQHCRQTDGPDFDHGLHWFGAPDFWKFWFFILIHATSCLQSFRTCNNFPSRFRTKQEGEMCDATVTQQWRNNDGHKPEVRHTWFPEHVTIFPLELQSLKSLPEQRIHCKLYWLLVDFGFAACSNSLSADSCTPGFVSFSVWNSTGASFGLVSKARMGGLLCAKIDC